MAWIASFPGNRNDDAIRSAALLTKVVASAVAEGLQARAGVGKGEGEAEAEGADEHGVGSCEHQPQ